MTSPYDEPPIETAVGPVLLAAACGASASGRRTKGPRAGLDRWIAVRDAVAQWAIERPDPDLDRIEDDLFGLLDPLQRSIASRLFARCREVIGDAVVDPEPIAARVIADDGRTVIRQAVTFALTHADGDTELLRLKLARPSDEDEAAILLAGSDPGTVVADLLADPGQVEELPIDRATAEARAQALLALATTPVSDPTPVPGFHCWRCDRTATCGAYPNPWGGDIPSRARTLTLSKSTLGRLAQCHRRVAWKAIHHVPVDDRDAFDDPSRGLVLGEAFHRAMEVALLDDDPAAVFEAYALALPASERDDLLHLWERHADLVADEPHPVAVRRTEYPFGVTIPVPDADTAVVVIGTIDAAGREADGTAALVEHRTGALADLPHLEQELYAVATWMATGEDRVAVHHHHLRADDDACTRRVFDADDLHDALARLAEAAGEIASWDPDDSLAPQVGVGPWCRSCDYETTCVAWRPEGTATTS